MTSRVSSFVDNDTFTTWLNIQTASGKDAIQSKLQTWSSNTHTLVEARNRFQRVQTTIQKDDEFAKECDAIFKDVSEMERKLIPLTVANSKLEKESYNELLFVSPFTRPFNFVPYLLTLWSFLRVYLLPGLSFLFPLLTLIAPYFILTYMFHIPITFKNYTQLLHSMISGNIQSVIQPSAQGFAEKPIEPIALAKQGGIIMMTVFQGIVQPYWTYKHLRSIDTIIHENGSLLTRFREQYIRLEQLLEKKGITFYPCPSPLLENERTAMARMLTDSFPFKLALKYIGSFEALYRLALKSEIKAVRWVRSATPVLRLTDAFDYQVPLTHRKTISASFDSHAGRHALLTGPNKGGKSTALRAMAMSTLLAHTYGCAFGQFTLTPFAQQFVCLKPDDLPGEKSRFEREIEFTAGTLTSKQPVLILIDELYHSTNPPDALRSCEIYSEQLWKRRNIISVISTHLFDWVDRAPESIQRLCCPATKDTNTGAITFSYRLSTGICKVSSVDSLLKSNGFAMD
jgi:hypothetical protein